MADRSLSVAVQPNAGLLAQDCHVLAGKIAFGDRVEFIPGTPDFSRYDAILSVGTATCPDLPWTVINSNGWLARASSGRSGLPAACDLTNPVGALAATRAVEGRGWRK